MPLDGFSMDQCLRKIKYPTYEAACLVAKRMAMTKHAIVLPYLCHFKADHWHVGRPTKEK